MKSHWGDIKDAFLLMGGHQVRIGLNIANPQNTSNIEENIFFSTAVQSSVLYVDHN